MYIASNPPDVKPAEEGGIPRIRDIPPMALIKDIISHIPEIYPPPKGHPEDARPTDDGNLSARARRIRRSSQSREMPPNSHRDCRGADAPRAIYRIVLPDRADWSQKCTISTLNATRALPGVS